jgi:hypothetical protein
MGWERTRWEIEGRASDARGGRGRVWRGEEGGEQDEAEVRLSWTSRGRMRHHLTIKNTQAAFGQHEKGRDAPSHASGGGGSNDNNDSSKENKSKDCNDNNRNKHDAININPTKGHDTNDNCDCGNNYAGITCLTFQKRQHDDDANDAQFPPHPTFLPKMTMSPRLSCTR